MNEIEKFNEWFEKHYYDEMAILKKACYFNTMNWDEDIYHQTYLNVINSIKNGKKLDYSKDENIQHYFFISYKNTYFRDLILAYNKNHAECKIEDLNLIQDDSTEDKEEDFKIKYKFLIQLEQDVKKHFKKDISTIFTKKFNGDVLNIKEGERKKFEIAKTYIKDKYKKYYEENIK